MKLLRRHQVHEEEEEEKEERKKKKNSSNNNIISIWGQVPGGKSYCSWSGNKRSGARQ